MISSLYFKHYIGSTPLILPLMLLFLFSDGSCHRDGSDEALLSREISDSCPSKGEDVSKTTAVAWEPSSREQVGVGRSS